MAKQIDKLTLGQKLEVLLQGEDGKALAREVLEVVRIPADDDPPNAYGLRSVEKTESAGDAPALVPQRGTKGGDPFDVLKFAWEVIKDGKPVSHTDGASSYVLYKDSDPLDYANSRDGHSGRVTFTVRDATFPDVVLVKTEFFLEGAYHATPNPKQDIPNGHYLPSIYFGFPICEVNAPFIVFNGKVEMGQPYNKGSHDDVQPHVKAYCALKFEFLFTVITRSFAFAADGKEGFRYLGPAL
jgi:hypothetical protein